MTDETKYENSLTRLQREKICSSLLHRIRVIQGQTNLNLSEPHFTDGKDTVRQTKDIIKNIKEGLQKGYSDILKTCEEHTRYHSDTSSTLCEKDKKKRCAQKTQSDKTTKLDQKLSKENKMVVQDAADFCEGAVRMNTSQGGYGATELLEKNQEQYEIQTANQVTVNGRYTRKKRKRKRKVDENDSNSSIHLNQNKNEASHGDAESIKVKPPRKLRAKAPNKKKTEISGDESDLEDSIATKPSDQTHNPNLNGGKPRRKLRMKRPKVRSPSATSLQRAEGRSKNISEMVSSTIQRLNDVNARVVKTIQESMSSSSDKMSFISLGTASNLAQPQQDNVQQNASGAKIYEEFASASSLDWSTVTMSNANDVSDVQIPLVKPVTKKAARKPQISKTKAPQVQIQSPPQQQEVQPESNVVPVVEDEISTTFREIPSIPSPNIPKIKKKKHKSSTEKEPKEESHKVEDGDSGAVKKRRSVKIKDPPSSVEPVTSSLKKSFGKRRKSKKKEHVVINSTPELMPDPPKTPPRPKSPVKIIRLPSPTVSPRKPPSATKTVREDISRTKTSRKQELTRRISSAKSYRHSPKKIITKVKSAGNLAPDKSGQPLSVRTVLMEENDESKRRNRSRTRSGGRPRSRSESRRREQDNRPRSRDLMEIYNNLRKNTANTIANINEQMSTTLKEGMAHLNDICGKVRTTLTDMEKDEENYKKLKSKKSYDVSSEGGSVHDESAIFMQPSKPAHTPDTPTKSSAPGETPKIQTFHTVITDSRQHTNIGQLMNSISMAGDNMLVELPQSKPPSSEKAKRRPSSKNKKRPISVKGSKVSAPGTPTSKTKVACAVPKTGSVSKASIVKIPIWQRTPPSVIEEIQLTVKKQATKSQYREFLRALKSIAKKQRSQVHVMPTDFKEVMEKQQEKVFVEPPKYKSARKKKDIKPQEEPRTKSKDICQKCSIDKCNCGVLVENTPTPANQQRTHWMHLRPDAKRAIQAYDILDEITLKDLEPIQSEYPRKDHIVDTDANKKIEETLLYKLLYHEDPKVLESLLSSTPQTSEQKPTSTISTSLSTEKQRSASNAYKLYEQLEFAVEKDKPVAQVHNLSATKGSICINSNDNRPKSVSNDGPKSVSNEKPKAAHTCPKEFNDEVNIPIDLRATSREKGKRKSYRVKLKSDEEVLSLRSKKAIEDKLRIIGKKSSIRSISKRNKRTKFSKENLRAKLKNYNAESKMKMKKILTVMPVSVYQTQSSSRKTSQIKRNEALPKKLTANIDVRTLKISEENREKIERMSKKEIIQKLKPYIFHDLKPPVVVVMPVYPKYNHQNKQQKQDHAPHFNRGPTYKRVSGFLKDHDEDCHSGKKLCRRCQMMMQCGDETSRKSEARKPEPLSHRQLWKNKFKATPAENLVKTVLGKNNSRKKFEVVPPDEKPSKKEMIITMTPKQLNKEATNTRKKLEEVKNIMENHKTFLGKDLDDIIDTLEFKIVDALSNPKNQHTDAFNEIEHEIKSILQTINELKEINKENVSGDSDKLKSKTSVSLQDSSERVVTSSSNRSTTDTDLTDAKNKKNEIKSQIATEIVSSSVTTPTDLVELEEVKVEESNNTYSILGKEIESVIEGLDAIMHVEEDTVDMKEETKEEVEQEVVIESMVVESEVAEVKVDESKDEESDCEEAINTFCQQVDEVIKNIENIDELCVSTDNLDNFAKDIEEKRSEDYFTPFMKAVKDYRQSDDAHNFVDFLDKLAMLSKESISLHFYPKIPLYTATLQQKAQVVEVAQTFNRAIQYEELCADKSTEAQFPIDEAVEVKEITSDKSTGVELIYGKPIEVDEIPLLKTPESDDLYYEANEGVESKEEILVTNQWMQTDSVEELEETTNEVLTQTIETGEQFTDIEEYVEEIASETSTQQSILLVSEKNTQVPSDIDHSCFVASSTKHAQVTPDLMEMTSITVGSQVESASNEVISIECQVISQDLIECPTVTSLDVVNGYSDVSVDGDKVSFDIEGMEKYITSRLEGCAPDASEISFDEYPRNVYTESYLTRDRYPEIHACEKRNSYPVTNIPQNRSDIISLYDSRKSCSIPDEEKDFLEEGFGKQSTDSYDSMLARFASSENISSKSSTMVTEVSVKNIIIPVETDKHKPPPDEVSPSKLMVNGPDYDNRHKHLLHSVYGIVFSLMFLGINLNYTCCN